MVSFIDFSTKGKSPNLTVFINISIRGMLECKDFFWFDIVFPIFEGYVDSYWLSWTLTTYLYLHNLHKTIVHDILYDNTLLGLSNEIFVDFDDKIPILGSNRKHTFQKNCEHVIHTLKIHLLDKLGEGLSKFRSLIIIAASPNEKFNTFSKTSYRSTSWMIASQMDETDT